MHFQKTFETVLKKEMTRKEFLGMVGLGLVSMVGVSSMLKNLGESFGHQQNKSSSSLNYGDNSYGGVKKSNGLF